MKLTDILYALLRLILVGLIAYSIHDLVGIISLILYIIVIHLSLVKG